MRRPQTLGSLLLLAAACGPAPTAQAPAIAAAPSASARAAVTSAAPAPAVHVTAGAFPGDVELYAELTAVPGLLDAARSTLGAAAVATSVAALGSQAGLSPELTARLLGALQAVHLGGRRVGDDLKVAASLAFSDAAPVRELLASGALVDLHSFGPLGQRLAVRDSGKGGPAIVWFEAPRLLVLGDERMAEAIAAVVEGRAPELTEAQRAMGHPPGDPRHASAFVAPALLGAWTGGNASFPAPLEVAYRLWESGIQGSYRVALADRDAGGWAPVPAPRSLALARRLPAETAGYIDLSTAIQGGREGATRLLEQLTAAGGQGATAAISGLDAKLGRVGLHLADLGAALGHEGVVAVVVRPGVTTPAELEKGYAVVFVQDVADPKPAERLLELARDDLTSRPGKARLHREAGGFTAEVPAAGVPFVRARLGAGRLFFALGARDLVDRAAEAVDRGKGTLGDDAAHARALTGLPPSSQLRLWLDLGRVSELAAALGPPSARAPLALWGGASHGPSRLTTGLTFTAAPESDRVRFELDEVNGLGVFAALGIHGVRRYLANAKTAEARNTLGAVARSAAAAYEREGLAPGGAAVVHALCRSAQPVPAQVPRAAKYQPSVQPGADYESGDDASGWRCLKFGMSMPQYYQYTYIVGGPYKGPARGGPDPGPDGFEVAAEGDLDGDGVTSLFTRVGAVNPQTHELVVSRELFVSHEFE